MFEVKVRWEASRLGCLKWAACHWQPVQCSDVFGGAPRGSKLDLSAAPEFCRRLPLQPVEMTRLAAAGSEARPLQPLSELQVDLQLGQLATCDLRLSI